MRQTSCLLALLLVALAGCDPEPSVLAPDGGEPPPPTDPVYFYEDVLPILAENCLMCHTAGGIAPFELGTYGDALEVGERMAEATRSRIMPPFVVDASGDCNHFTNARRLEDAEIDVIGDWVAGGMLEGDPSTPEPPTVTLPTLDRVSSTLDIGVQYEPDHSITDDYRCFVVEPDWTGIQYITGADVRPGNAEIAHHLIVFAPISAAEGERARRLDGSDGRPGYPCFGDAVVTALPVVLWAPGAGAQRYPEGTGIRLDGSVPLVVQMHYNLLADNGEPDRTVVDLTLEDRVDTEAWMGLVADFGLEIPPRMPSFTNEYEGNIAFGPGGAYRVWGAFPHMHTMGRQLRVEAMDATSTCMVDVPRWDFNWQGGFWYETPIDLEPNQPMRLSCTYDSMERDAVTYWGDSTQDEMCLSFFYVTRR